MVWTGGTQKFWIKVELVNTIRNLVILDQKTEYDWYSFMPKATAVWLVENTNFTFKQIAEFCKLHELEIKGIADGMLQRV